MADISIIKPKKSNFIPGPLGAAIDAQRTATLAAGTNVWGVFTTDSKPFNASIYYDKPNQQPTDNDGNCGGGDLEIDSTRKASGCCIDSRQKKCLRNGVWPNNKAHCPVQESPSTGTITSVEYIDPNGGGVKCTYTNISVQALKNASFMSNFPNDGEDIKRTFCEGITDAQRLLENQDICEEFFNRGNSTTTTSEGWDERVIALCAAAPDAWTGVAGCIEAARRSIQNNDANSTAASTMVNTYCRGGDGTDETANGPGNHRTDDKCACLNARDLGFKGENSCLAEANKSLPGCDKLYTKMKLLVDAGSAGYNAIQGFVTDPGCISQDCDLAKAAGGTAQIFPYKSAAADCINVQFDICDIDITQGIAQNSAVQAQCDFGDDVVAGAPGAAGAPGMAGDEEEEDEEEESELPITWKPFAKIFDTETKQYAFMASCCVTCLLLVILLIFMMKGPSGPSSQNLLAAKLASI